MDFILEMLFEIIIEGTIEGSTSVKIPKLIRIILLIAVLGLYGFLTGIFIFIAIRYTDMRLIGIGVVILFVWFMFSVCRKFYRKWKE